MSVQKLEAQREEIAFMPKIIWHKCNSSSKFIEAINLKDVAGLEFDVMATSDNVPVVFHDKSITQEMIGGELSYLVSPIEVSKISFADLRKKRPDIEGLREVFDAVNKNGFQKDFEFHLEIKPDNIVLADGIMKLLNEFPEIDKQTIPRSFQQNVLKYIKQNYTGDVCLLLGDKRWVEPLYMRFNTENTNTYLSNLPDNVEAIEKICGGIVPKYVSVHYNMLTEPFINAMKKAEIETDVYTLNDLKCLKGRVDRIVTDKPEEIYKKLLKQKRREFYK